MFQRKGFCNTKMSISVVLFSALVFLLLFTSYAGAQIVQCTCDSCHGNPPVGDAHDHFTKIKQGITCDSCHFNGMPTTPITDTKFQMGFSINGKDGKGMTYDGLTKPVLGATYEATNNTTVTQNGSMKCTNVYCHGGGMGGTNNTGGITGSLFLNSINDPRPLTASVSPSWNDVVPIGCDYCHGYPPSYQTDKPKANTHTATHGGSQMKCNWCHYDTTHDGVTIYDVTKHHNGVYDVTPDPNGVNPTWPINFSYTYDAGGGKCSNNSCHGGGSSNWGGQIRGAAINVSSGPGCFEISAKAVSLIGNGTGAIPPYTYDWDWGDGITTSGVSSTTPINTPYKYAKSGTYFVKFSYRDGNYHPGEAITQVSVSPVNASPTTNGTVSVTGYVATLTDLSYDPDYNTCGHNGAPGTILIDWYDGTTTEQPINLTDKPSNQQYTHTYANKTTAYQVYIRLYITDNAGKKVGTGLGWYIIPK